MFFCYYDANEKELIKLHQHASGTTPRTVDLSGIQLSMTSAAILSDIFAIEWGLRKVVFRECDLDEHVGLPVAPIISLSTSNQPICYPIYDAYSVTFCQILKPILHSLLIPDSLHFLSVASNRRLRSPAYRLIAAYLTKVRPVLAHMQFAETRVCFSRTPSNSLTYRRMRSTVAPSSTLPRHSYLRLQEDSKASGLTTASSSPRHWRFSVRSTPPGIIFANQFFTNSHGQARPCAPPPSGTSPCGTTGSPRQAASPSRS